jgi:hypothetical protein
VIGREAEGTGRHVVLAVDGHATLGRAVCVDHLETEATRETFDDLR